MTLGWAEAASMGAGICQIGESYTAAQMVIRGSLVGSQRTVTRSLFINPIHLLEAVSHTLNLGPS